MDTDDDEGFQNYDISTVDAGNAGLAVTILVCIGGIGILPLLVSWRRRCQRRSTLGTTTTTSSKTRVVTSAQGMDEGNGVEGSPDEEDQSFEHVSFCVVAKWDKESQRLCRLGAPFMVGAIAQGLADIIRVALIGRFLSTRALSAYLVVELMLGPRRGLLEGIFIVPPCPV
jgi:hypothetical protein